MLIAHGGHWLVTVSYFLPVAGALLWLGIVTLRRRRWERARRQGGDDSAVAGRGGADRAASE